MTTGRLSSLYLLGQLPAHPLLYQILYEIHLEGGLGEVPERIIRRDVLGLFQQPIKEKADPRDPADPGEALVSLAEKSPLPAFGGTRRFLLPRQSAVRPGQAQQGVGRPQVPQAHFGTGQPDLGVWSLMNSPVSGCTILSPPSEYFYGYSCLTFLYP